MRILVIAALLLPIPAASPAQAAELTSEAVLKAIQRAQEFLIGEQRADGSWTPHDSAYPHGTSCLAILALVNSGLPSDHPTVAKGLNYLRSLANSPPERTYEVALMAMALSDAKAGQRDRALIMKLARWLEEKQITTGNDAGLWNYGTFGSGDRSNGQFAVLGLQAAAHAGIPVERRTWELADRHWTRQQQPDGGWNYSGGSGATGSMTVAGIATLTITSAMLRDGDDFNPDGTPRCCQLQKPNEAIERGLKWLERHFSVRANPQSQPWYLYYLYGLERAGRLSGRRFIGQHDWYREGAEVLVARQLANGAWTGTQQGVERNPNIATSLSLLFLSKGLAPVLVNKLKFGPLDPVNKGQLASDDWNNHPDDARHLVEFISGRPRWPKLLNWQVLDIQTVLQQGGVADLLQSPILYLSGRNRPEFSDQQLELMREYVNQGGFIFAVNNCGQAAFEEGMHDIVKRMFPTGEASLKKLPPDHPIFRSEYVLDTESVELWGADVGCRTAIVFSPEDLSCLWDKWAILDPPERTADMKARVTRSLNIGVNIVAYATGREPPTPLDNRIYATQEGAQDRIERGLLQIAKLRHTGGWDAAPQALRNLLLGLNRSLGMSASTKQRNLTAADPNLFKYPIVYMHGRTRFEFSPQEREQLKLYLERGGVLFADACCGASQFQISFQQLMREIFPNRKLERIPPDHELFTAKIGFDVRQVRRRQRQSGGEKAALNMVVQTSEPFLEGIEIDGRLAVIYSKYDISCALERQASQACEGYLDDDAFKLAANVVLYAMLQDVRYYDEVR